MSEDIKPIKRSKELAPLSREHHDGLLFAWRLKEGLKLKSAVGKMKEYTSWYWQQHIKPHFFQEEKILLPYLPSDHPMALQLKEEHDLIREFIISLDQEADRGTLARLADLVNDHIRFEERQLFPFLEQTLPAEDLKKIYDQLEEHPVCPGIWKDEFWVRM